MITATKLDNIVLLEECDNNPMGRNHEYAKFCLTLPLFVGRRPRIVYSEEYLDKHIILKRTNYNGSIKNLNVVEMSNAYTIRVTLYKVAWQDAQEIINAEINKKDGYRLEDKTEYKDKKFFDLTSA